MILLPSLMIGSVLGLLMLLGWMIYRRRFCRIETGIQIIVSAVSVVSGLSYFIVGLMNVLNSYIKSIPTVVIEIQEAMGVISFSGIIFFLVGLDQLKKYWQRKK